MKIFALIYRTATGFQIVVDGYNHKMRLLLEEIVGKIANFEVKADRFSVIKLLPSLQLAIAIHHITLPEFVMCVGEAIESHTGYSMINFEPLQTCVQLLSTL
ncbi:hypothetical protein Taro_018661 [Colocasia esculenta]|uniref:Peptidase M16 middle/third domain-containing protein n=1 Tax=Colocasia esculenta TaxID=4460 RepID=A0A843UJ78_COLES|nr:hypothetical protein [Colocasia esculenta]